MPTYTTHCQTCGDEDIIYRKVAFRDDLPPCKCGGALKRIIDLPMVALFPAYESPLDGRPITSRSERNADLQKAGAYEWEPGIEKDIARKKEYNLKESFEPISQAVDNIVRDLNVCGKLENLNG